MRIVFNVLLGVAVGSAASIVDLAVATPDLSTLVAALKAADLVSTLSGNGPFTVFAPTNEAFAALPAGVLDNLLKPENKAQLVDILTYHVVSGDVQSKDLKDKENIKTVEGKDVTARVSSSQILINTAKVTAPNNEASNGVVHIIDAVLMPSDAPKIPSIADLAAGTPDLSTLVTALTAGSLVDTLSGKGPFTVFAPTNKAFDRLPAGTLATLLKPENKAQLVDLLTYHVVPSDVLPFVGKQKFVFKTVEGKNLTLSVHLPGGGNRHYYFYINDQRIGGGGSGSGFPKAITASNGIIYEIDQVLTVPIPPNTIVDVAARTPDLSTLVTALKAAGLTGTLSGKKGSPFTVFAPTNEAFAALPDGVLANLLKPENKAQLVDILTYHVASGDVQSKDLTDMELIRTLEGRDVTARVHEKNILINSARVITPDNEATNGVVHIIDAVLMPGSGPKPPQDNIVQLAASTSQLSTLVTALKAAGLVDTLSGKGPFTVFAPSNAAFAALPPGDLANLLNPENKAQLVDLLTYHVASGNVQSVELKDMEKIPTVEGQEVTARVSSTEILINSAKVIAADNEATNGVVHIIDAILQEPKPPPTGNHLWFRGWTELNTAPFGVSFQCGEVDAGPRMPDAIFDKSNSKILKAYEDITIDLFRFVSDLGTRSTNLHLELGRCRDNNYNVTAIDPPFAPNGVRDIDWAPELLMDAICQKQCLCNYDGKNRTTPLPKCPDVPDDPKAGKWCSLCGPKYNAPIQIDLFRCKDRFNATSCPGPKGVPGTGTKRAAQLM